jgi:hypothetical protein
MGLRNPLDAFLRTSVIADQVKPGLIRQETHDVRSSPKTHKLRREKHSGAKSGSTDLS